MLASSLSSLTVPAAAPQLAGPPELTGLYRAGISHLVPVMRREGDSLRFFFNYPKPAVGSAVPRLQLTAWAGYDARQPLWQAVRALHLYPGSDPAAPVQVLTAAVAAGQLAAGQALQLSLNAPAAPAAASAASAALPADQSPATTAWLSLTPEHLARPFVLLDSTGLLLNRPYLRAGEGVAVAVFGLSQPVRWRRYAAGRPALPPFADPHTQPAVPRTLGVLDSSATPVADGQLLRFPKQGLYALRVGGRGGEPVRTVPLLVARPDFPNLTTAPELIEALLYLTTATERQSLLQTADPKRAVDRFWLQAAGDDQARARDLIRRYYGQITTANELFTGHKAGWLTDRGLLYVVLGPPQSVRRAAGQEVWHYDHASREGEAVEFTFRARPSTLAPDNYELVRRPEYQLLWYAAVEQWRRPLTIR